MLNVGRDRYAKRTARQCENGVWCPWPICHLALVHVPAFQPSCLGCMSILYGSSNSPVSAALAYCTEDHTAADEPLGSLMVPTGEDGVRWVTADAMHLPFPDNMADAYTISFGLRNVQSRARGRRERRG